MSDMDAAEQALAMLALRRNMQTDIERLCKEHLHYVPAASAIKILTDYGLKEDVDTAQARIEEMALHEVPKQQATRWLRARFVGVDQNYDD